MGALTKIQGVNRMLRAAGEAPVNSLSDDGINDTNIAEAVLDETVYQIQFEDPLNTSTVTVDLIPDTNGFISVPDHTVALDTAGTDAGLYNVTTRGRNPTRIYNLGDDTDVWTVTKLNVRYTVALSFESLPTPQQFRAVDAAAWLYQHETVGDEFTTQFLDRIAQVSRIFGRANDMRAKDYNLLTGSSPQMAQVRKPRRAW